MGEILKKHSRVLFVEEEKVMKFSKRGCWVFLTVAVIVTSLLVWFIINLFTISREERIISSLRVANIFKAIDLPPQKVTTNGSYQTEGGGLNYEMYYSKKQFDTHPVLKTSPNRERNKIIFYVLSTGDINYFDVTENLFNPGLYQLLEEKETEYCKKIGKPVDETYSILYWNSWKDLKKGIPYYEKALKLVSITDRSKDNSIDDVAVKPGKEKEFEKLIIDMYNDGLVSNIEE